MGFFARSDAPRIDAFSLFSWQHILLLALLACCIAAGLRLIRRLQPPQAKKVIYGAAILVPVLEFSHSLWMYLTGTTALVKLLPLHLCGLQSIFIPLAVFTKIGCFRDYVYATSLLGGLFGTVFPAGVADYYPLFSFQTLQTFALHGLLLFVPLAMIACGMHRPALRRFPRVLCVFLSVALIVGMIDGFFGENYMFLFAPPAGTPLVWIFDTFGHGIYLACTCAALVGASLLFHLPFRGEKPESVPETTQLSPASYIQVPQHSPSHH